MSAGTIRRAAPRWRMLPPVHSPLPLRAVLAGFAGALRPGARGSAARLIRSELGEARVVLYDSGTSALRVAFRLAANARGGAPVAIPAFGCYDLATAAVGAGVRVLAYDLDPATLAPDPDSLDAALARGAGAVLVAPLYGIPVPWDDIAARAAAANALLIEDAAQGDGCDWRGRPLGSLGPISVLSFGRGKGWTGGRGGALLLRPGVARGAAVVRPPAPPATETARVLAAAVAQWALARPAAYRFPARIPGLALGRTVYRQPRPPARMTRAAAAILAATRAEALREHWIRQYNARRLLDALAGVDGVRPVRAPAGGTATYLRFPVLVEAGAERVAASARARELGVAYSYPSPLTALGPLRPFLANRDGRWPGAELLAGHLVTLPTHRFVRDEDVAGIARLLGEAAATARAGSPGREGEAGRGGPGGEALVIAAAEGTARLA